eukprot:scaffold4246_cov84-Isochrysis_galbana.AAC.2
MAQQPNGAAKAKPSGAARRRRRAAGGWAAGLKSPSGEPRRASPASDALRHGACEAPPFCRTPPQSSPQQLSASRGPAGGRSPPAQAGVKIPPRNAEPMSQAYGGTPATEPRSSSSSFSRRHAAATTQPDDAAAATATEADAAAGKGRCRRDRGPTPPRKGSDSPSLSPSEPPPSASPVDGLRP